MVVRFVDCSRCDSSLRHSWKEIRGLYSQHCLGPPLSSLLENVNHYCAVFSGMQVTAVRKMITVSASDCFCRLYVFALQTFKPGSNPCFVDFQTLALLGTGLFIYFMGFTKNYYVALFLVAMALTCNAFHTSAVCVVPQDIAPKFSGSVFGNCSCFVTNKVRLVWWWIVSLWVVSVLILSFCEL